MRTAAYFFLLVAIHASTASILHAQVTTRVSVDSNGAQGDGYGNNLWTGISADGRFVAFGSTADNLVAGDTNGCDDVFVHDRLGATTERVSVDSIGVEGNGVSGRFGFSISSDGRYVTFSSRSDNLVPGDTNGYEDIFVRDRLTGTTEIVSIDSAGILGDDASGYPSISADGRFVAFTSSASNFVAGDTNGVDDVFVRDRNSGTTERVSVDSLGNQANGSSLWVSISANGRVVAFDSQASNLVWNDTNGVPDVFVHDRQNGKTRRVSVDSSGNEGLSYSGTPVISANGQFVAFASKSSNLVAGDQNNHWDEFVRDRAAGTTERVSIDSNGVEGDNDSGYPSLASITEDGRFVAFVSAAKNLVPGDSNAVADVFVRDRQLGLTKRVSVDSFGAQANAFSDGPALSADARSIAFESDASNLVANDSNGWLDTFVNGANLTLEMSPDVAPAGATITTSTWTGAASGPSLLVVTEVNGTAMFVPAVLASFDAVGGWTFAATVPSGLSGNVIAFEVFGIVPSGKVDVSNAFAVTFN
jgi:hypothetical protein